MATKLTGDWGTVSINGVGLCVNKHEVTATCKLEEVPDSCTPGYMLRTPGMRDWKASITVWFDGVTPPSISEGDEVVNLRLGYKKGSTINIVSFSAASGFVASKKLTNPRPGSVSYDIEIDGNGSYQWADIPAQVQSQSVAEPAKLQIVEEADLPGELVH